MVDGIDEWGSVTGMVEGEGTFTGWATGREDGIAGEGAEG